MLKKREEGVGGKMENALQGHQRYDLMRHITEPYGRRAWGIGLSVAVYPWSYILGFTLS